MVKLQTPQYALRNGELIPWDQATLHIGCEGVNRGLSIFEGLKGYWQQDGGFSLVETRKHYDRLLRSARQLHIPCPWTYEQYCEGMFTLIRALITPERDMWVRTTLFVVEGHWGEDTKADMIMTAYHTGKDEPEPINVGVSTWQRSSDNSLPYRVKSAVNYQVGRLARIEGRARECSDMVLLNGQGRVAELTGSALLMVNGGKVTTPSHTEGVLESITVDCVESIAAEAGIEFERRPIDRTELHVADELCACGTLAELVPIRRLDLFDFDPAGPAFTELRKSFFATVRGKAKHGSIAMTPVPL